MKKCPYCDEEIQDDAIKCRFCKEMLISGEKKKEIRVAGEVIEKASNGKNLLKQAVSVSVYERGFVRADYDRGINDDYIHIKFLINNNTDKSIEGIKGGLVFKDIFDDILARLEVKHDEKIRGKTKAKQEGFYSYNQYDIGMQKLVQTDMNKITVDWEPELLIFEDGTKLQNR